MEHSVISHYTSLLQNSPLALAYEANLSSVQKETVPTLHIEASTATDMGNVSRMVPSLHPVYYIGGQATNHTREFAEDAG